MARYGNIITLYNPQGTQVNDVSTILSSQHAKFELVDSTFFVETNSLVHTRKVQEDIAATNVSYTFFFNKISDGSFLKGSINDPDKLNRITKILFE